MEAGEKMKNREEDINKYGWGKRLAMVSRREKRVAIKRPSLLSLVVDLT